MSSSLPFLLHNECKLQMHMQTVKHQKIMYLYFFILYVSFIVSSRYFELFYLFYLLKPFCVRVKYILLYKFIPVCFIMTSLLKDIFIGRITGLIKPKGSYIEC